MSASDTTSHHQLLCVIPQDAEAIDGWELDRMVRGLLQVVPDAESEGVFDTIRRAVGGPVVQTIDDLRITRTLEDGGFRALSDADRRRVYLAARLPLRELLRESLRVLPNRIEGLDVRFVRADEVQDRALRCVGESFVAYQVYAAHPYVPGLYVPISRFHSHLLDEKRSEFVELMSSLGARSLRLAHAETEKNSAQTGAGFDGVKGVNVGVKAGARASTGSRFSLAMTIEERPRR